MKISINKVGKPVLELDESDMADAFHISQMMETEGWKRLMPYWAATREALIERVKNASRATDRLPLSPVKAAALDGFDECMGIPLKVIARADEFKEDNKPQKEETNGTNYTGE